MLKSINRIKTAAQFIIGAVDLYENELKKDIGTEDHRRNVLLYRIMQDMQEINNEYDLLFSRLKNTHKTVDGKTYTASKETTETPEEFRTIINALINLHGINIEICGKWLWITGNTKPHKVLTMFFCCSTSAY